MLKRIRLFALPLASFAFWAGAVRAQSISTYVRSSAPEAHIEVDAGAPASYRVPRTIYGTFLEDIGHSIFGGVSAELLDNPSLEPYHASLRTLSERFSAPDFSRSTAEGLPLPWLPLDFADGWRYEPRLGRAANSDWYLYLMGLDAQAVGIRQSLYLPIEREREYTGVLFASTTETAVELEVSFRKHDAPHRTLALARLSVPSTGQWSKLPFRLILPPGAVEPLEPVDFAVAVEGGHRVSLDEIRLYPADAVDGLLDPEIIRAARALRTPLLRYGGNFTSGYHWQDGIGPIDRRPTMLNQAWGYPEYNEFGTDELMTFCRLIGAKPQICLNLGSGTAGEARAWVEYCQGSAESPQGARRAANGHRDPYPVAAWELGNELWGHFQIGWQTPQGYARRYRTFYHAIRNLVPPRTMVFANGADIDFYQDWNGALISQDASDLSFLTSHFVVGTDDLKDKNRAVESDAVWGADFAIPVGVGRALAPLRDQIDASPATRGRVRLAYTEWLFAAPEGSNFPRWDNLGGAIDAAGWLNMLLTHADFVPVSDMTGLLEFGGIYKRRGRVFVTPQYWAFWLYSNYAGDTPVAARIETREYDAAGVLRRLPATPDVPYLDFVATRDSSSRDLALFVVNRDWKSAIPARLEIRHFRPAAEATVRTLNADSILARNDEEHPNAVQPVTSKLAVSGDSLNCVFPAHSITEITIAAAR